MSNDTSQEINRETYAILDTLNQYPSGLGANELLKKLSQKEGTNKSRTPFFKLLNEAKRKELIEVKGIGKRKKHILTITEKGKLVLSGKKIIEIFQGLPFQTSSKVIRDMFEAYANSLPNLVKLEIEGPASLPSVDIRTFWVTKEDGSFSEKPMLQIVFSKNYRIALQNLVQNPKAWDLFQDICIHIWLSLLSPMRLDRFVNVAIQLEKQGLIRNFASTSYFGSMLADHFLLALEAIANSKTEGAIATLIHYDPKDDLIKPPSNDRQQVFNQALRYAWEQLNKEI